MVKYLIDSYNKKYLKQNLNIFRMIFLLLGIIRIVAFAWFRSSIIKEKVLGESWYEAFFVIGIFFWSMIMTIFINMYLLLGVTDINRINYCLN